MPQPPIVPISPLTGPLDLRSEPDQLPQGAMRMRQNFQTTGQGKLRRGPGFEKFLNTSNYNNADFHDQLLSLSGATGRQPITLLFEAESTRRVRTLFIATQQTVAQLNTHSGNYLIMGSGFGGTFSTSATAPRFKAAKVGDYVALTNDFDKIQFARLEQGADPDTGKYLITNPELDTIGLSSARVIWEWKNVLFLANVVMDGERASYRIVWSDFDNPFGSGSFDPAVLSSITGTKDLFTHEEILAGAPCGNSFLIYTTHGIWEMTAVGGDQSFDFRRIYNGEKDELKGCLAYANTLVNNHDVHYFIARDGAYVFGQYYSGPDRAEWMHRATFDLFTKADQNACDAHIGFIYGDDIYFSIASVGAQDQCPDYTLRVNSKYQTADVIDHGFVAAAQFSPQDIQSIRDFIIETGICSIAGLASLGYPYGKEGLPRELPTGQVPFNPTRFYTNILQSIGYAPGYYISEEDWNQYNSYHYSICYLVGYERLDEICRTCKQDPLLLGVSSVDWCIKQLGKVFYRERCTNTSAVGITDSNGYSASIGTYLLDGITSILRTAPAFASDSLIELSQVELKFLPVAQVSPLGISLRVGISAQPADPNTGTGIVFRQFSTKSLAYQTARNQAQHLAANTSPTARALWKQFIQGRFIYIELTIAGVGGDATFSSLEAEIKSAGRTKNF